MLRRLLYTVFFCMLAGLSCQASNQKLLSRLDSILSNREAYHNSKEMYISILKNYAKKKQSKEELLKIYEDLYQEYYVYQFDSARVYINKAILLSQQIKRSDHVIQNLLYKVQLFGIGGLYSEASNLLNTIQVNKMPKELYFLYYITRFTLYSYRSDYCNDDYYSPRYRALAAYSLKMAMPYLTSNMPEYDFYHGEYNIYVTRNDKKALSYYFKTISHQKETSRYYAMACFAIANNYNAHGDTRKYEKYLIQACISDALCNTRENLALQDFAIFLFKEGQKSENHVERADKYINIALEDAKLYNNRLRILEISQKLPTIVSTYEGMIKSNNRKLELTISIISILIFISIFGIVLIFRQNKLLALHRKQFCDSNNQLTLLNNKLNILNSALLDTNRKREGLAKLYIDLCAKYIDRLSKYQNLVKRKIKANQVNELLSTISSSRLSEENAKTFTNRFDKAFLDLYPTFIDEFNSLLIDGQSKKKEKMPKNSMTNEQRIYALIRLGVQESSEIASLLFYSPQTIYNYRSAVKNRAKNKDTFDDDVQNLCTIIK
ncbi:DUF6377 domain-containing protein [Prevotella sp.]|uniref:DUF6377 domain-containing protein n=1 Tax=Prevotella sp. TaxID=59823 RepID=UPI002649BACB|nr:DUF6377 domain-containing protein [Prevotella sp.]MDN5554928.1 DUF6377 domain-containing protein [Prevotella sp.]